VNFVIFPKKYLAACKDPHGGNRLDVKPQGQAMNSNPKPGGSLFCVYLEESMQSILIYVNQAFLLKHLSN
jgi:hypothetical protein